MTSNANKHNILGAGLETYDSTSLVDTSMAPHSS